MLTSMSSEDPTPPLPAAGGFVAEPRRKVADAILAAREAALAELPIEIRWPAPADRQQGIAAYFTLNAPPFVIEGEVSRGESGLVITRVSVAAPPPSGVTQRSLRDTPLGGILKAIRAHVAWQEAMREGTRVFLGQEPAPGLFEPEDVQIPQTSGRTPMTDELLRQVALAFIEETGPGKDKRAIQRMAERFDRPEGTLRTWIARARKEGWLAPGSKGRIGADPGPKLEASMGRRDVSSD